MVLINREPVDRGMLYNAAFHTLRILCHVTCGLRDTSLPEEQMYVSIYQLLVLAPSAYMTSFHPRPDNDQKVQSTTQSHHYCLISEALEYLAQSSTTCRDIRNIFTNTTAFIH